MSSIFKERLARALSNAINEAGSKRPTMERGSFAKELGFSQPMPGRDIDDLAMTRFPAGLPDHLRDAILKKFKIPSDMEGLDNCCLVVKDEKNKKASIDKLGPDDIEYDEVWTNAEIVNALWPIISRVARTYTSGGWNKTSGSFDREAFTEFVQNAVIGIVRAIQSGEDRGDPYLPWAKTRMKGMVSSGVGVDKSTDAASGFLGELVDKVKTPEQLDALLNSTRLDKDKNPFGIDPRDRGIDGAKPRRPVDGNRYGEHAPHLYEIATRLRELLVAHKQATDPDDKADLADEIKGTKEDINNERLELKSHGRILGALTGYYDTITTPHSDRKESRLLTKLIGTTNPDQINQIERPANKEAAELYDKYVAAVSNGNEDATDLVRSEIERWMEKQGDRNAFRKAHKRKGLEVQSPATGKTAENPDLPSAHDTYVKSFESKEAVRDLLIAAIEGVPWKDSQGTQHIMSLTPREFRIAIRMFGIADYPFRGTGKDPEVDQARYDELLDGLMATVGVSAEEAADKAVRIKPVSAVEMRWLVEISTKRITGTYEDYENNEEKYENSIEQYQRNKEELIQYYKDFKEVLVAVPDEDTAMEVALRCASSDWVRKGCQQLRSRDIRKEFFADKSHQAANNSMKGLIGSPPTGQQYVGPGGADPMSKLAKIGRILHKELNIDEFPEFRKKPKSEDIAKEIDALIESTLLTMWNITEHYMKRAAITEALDDTDMRLLAHTHDVFGSYVTAFYLNGLR